MKKSELGKFEQSIEKLEAMIATLEADGTSLQQSLASFKEGISLVSKSQEFLDHAEQEVNVLTGSKKAQIEVIDDESN